MASALRRTAEGSPDRLRVRPQVTAIFHIVKLKPAHTWFRCSERVVLCVAEVNSNATVVESLEMIVVPEYEQEQPSQ